MGAVAVPCKAADGARWAVVHTLCVAMQGAAHASACSPNSASAAEGNWALGIEGGIRYLHSLAYVTTDATQAPMCTIGPSGPIGRPALTAHTVPTNLVIRVRMRSRLGTWLPFR